MTDDTSNFFDSSEHVNDITPNIEFQLNKYEDFECFKKRNIKDANLFINDTTLQNIKKICEHDCDVPLIIYGQSGIGKLTAVLALIKYTPCYLPDLHIDKKINNLEYFKSYSEEYNKILFYENVFYINLDIMANNNEILNYLRFCHKISRSKGFQDERKIFIIKHIEKYNNEIQKKICYILDRLNSLSSFIFIVNSPFNLPIKIVSTCLKIHYKILTESEFNSKFEYNYRCYFTINEWKCAKEFYKIYKANDYNIGNTIAYIKYLKTMGQLTTTFLKKADNLQSLTTKIAQSFIKKHLVLSNISRLLDIRKFIYQLLSINFDPFIIAKTICKLLLNTKVKLPVKLAIVQEICNYSRIYKNANKEVIPLETLFYKLILIIYGTITSV
jgi:hypothetical protein